jgi:hypothetical protein
VSTVGFSQPDFWHLGTDKSALATIRHATELCAGPTSRRWTWWLQFSYRHNRSCREQHVYHLSCSKLKGYLKPGGNNGFSPSGIGATEGLVDFEEFPAFPDLRIPFLGGIRFNFRDKSVTLTRTNQNFRCYVIYSHGFSDSYSSSIHSFLYGRQ